MISYTKQIGLIALAMVALSCAGPNSEKANEAKAHKYAYLLDKNPDSLSYIELYNRALNLWEIPFEEIDCETHFGKAHILVTGPKDAPPLVLLHGMNASSTMWYPNIESLSKDHRVYAIDFLLEVNKSGSNDEAEETSDIMNWYQEVFSCLGLKEFSIVGASRGGWLATKIALENPEQINKLVLLSPAQAIIWIPPSQKMLTNIIYTVRPNREDLRKSLESLSHNVDTISQLYIDQYYRATTQAELNSSIFKMQPFDEDEWASLAMPVLLLIGDHDFINNEKSIELAQENIPNVETATISRAGHFLSIDQAAEVNKRLEAFLAK